MPDFGFQHNYKIFTVCMDDYQADVPVGTLYHPSLPQGEGFLSLSQLIFKIQQLLDSFPSSPSAAFSPSPPAVSPSDPPPEGKRATFLIRVLFQENASWQGSVLWLEGRREASFRSVLELVLLIHRALLDLNTLSKRGTSFRSLLQERDPNS